MAKQKVFIKANSFTRAGFSARYLFVKNLNVPGAEFRIQYSVAGEQFEDELDKGASIAGLPDLVSNWVFYNDTANDLVIDLKIGNTYYQKNELVGDVNALVRDANLTEDGMQFFAGDNAQAAPAAFSSVCLVNLLGSINNVFINRIKLWSIGGDASFRLIDDFATDGEAAYIGLLRKYATNKDLKAPPSSYTQVGRDGFSATIQGVGLNNNNILSSSTGEPTEVTYNNSPIKLSPNQALVISGNAVNTEVAALFDFSEKKI